MKQTFDVMGMTCASCSAHVDKSVRNCPGVEAVNVNLLSENMEVEYDETKISPETIIQAVQKGGYDAKVKGEEHVKTHDQDEGLKTQKQALIISFSFMLPLFYLSMGRMMGWPLPFYLSSMSMVMVFALLEALLTLPVLIINRHYFITGFKSLFHLAPNMDSLIALGSGASCFYSLYIMFSMAYALGNGHLEQAHMLSMNLYFESAAMILTLISLGKYFEARSKKKTKDALDSLMNLAPHQATVLIEGKEQIVDINDIKIGDQVIVRSGEAIPVDGKIIKGMTSVDESMITGESLPVDKKEEDLVIGSTINKNGYIVVETLKTNAHSTLSQIIALVEEAGNSKAPIARLADKISGVFVPIVMGIALLAFLAWIFLGKDLHFALTMGISVLVISCPCALGLATPTAIMVGTGKAAKLGLLVKSAESLETMSHVNMIVFDKTGTLTKGEPHVVNVIEKDPRFHDYAFSLESKSNHPLAKAIVASDDYQMHNVDDYEEIPGEGIRGMIDKEEVLSGNEKMMKSRGIVIPEHEDFAKQGKTALYFAIGGAFAGIMALQDEIKPEAKEMIDRLHKRGIKTLMLTGDHERTAQAIAGSLDMDYQAEVLPQDKERVVRSWQEQGYLVAMAGDGINDAPALMRADVGISFTSGLDIAIDSSDIVLMKNDLRDLDVMISLSHAIMKNIKENLFWAFFYNVIGIPIAAGLFYPAFGWQLSPMLGAAAMSFSSVFVVSNALRLRFFKADKEIDVDRKDPKEEKKMEKTLKVEGMMCDHCRMHVEKALNGVEGVEAHVDLEKKEAHITCDQEVSDETLKAAVKDAGYEVTEIR